MDIASATSTSRQLEMEITDTAKDLPPAAAVGTFPAAPGLANEFVLQLNELQIGTHLLQNDYDFSTGRGKDGRYSYYVCANRVNKGQTCASPIMRREVLDDLVLDTVEKQAPEPEPERLRTLLSDILDLSDQKRIQREAELTEASAEKTRRFIAIERLYISMETGGVGPRDPIFAKRMDENRSALAASTTRLVTLEAQLAKGSRKITPASIKRFGELLSGRLRDDDPTLRKAYLRMLVSKVTVSKEEIVISGPKVVLENGVCNGAPRLMGMVPIFDRKWCRLQDSNL